MNVISTKVLTSHNTMSMFGAFVPQSGLELKKIRLKRLQIQGSRISRHIQLPDRIAADLEAYGSWTNVS